MGYKLYDLSWPNVHMGPQWPHLGMFHERVLRRAHGHTTGLPGGISRQVSIWESALHSATHMDAPAHEKTGMPPKSPLTGVMEQVWWLTFVT